MMLDDAVAEVKARVADVMSHTNSISVNDEKAIAWVLAAVRDCMVAAGELGARFRFYTRVGGHQWDRAGFEAEIERRFGLPEGSETEGGYCNEAG
jgi:hypothetical protein